MNILNKAFEFLTSVGVVTSQEQFSTHFLFKSARYYSMILATDREASVEALASLAARMVDLARNLKISPYGSIFNDGETAEKLSQKLWNTVYRQSLARSAHVRSKKEI